MLNIIKLLLKKIHLLHLLHLIKIHFSNLLIFLNWRPIKSSIIFSNIVQVQCDELKKNGVIKIKKSYLDFSNYLNDIYLNQLES